MAARAPPTTIFCGWLTSQGKIAGVRYFENTLLALPDLGWSSTYCSGSALQSGAMLARPSTSLTSVFFKDSRKTVAFAGRGAATKRTCKQTTACLLKAKFDATREQVYPKAIITNISRLLDLKGLKSLKNT